MIDVTQWTRTILTLKSDTVGVSLIDDMTPTHRLVWDPSTRAVIAPHGTIPEAFTWVPR